MASNYSLPKGMFGLSLMSPQQCDEFIHALRGWAAARGLHKVVVEMHYDHLSMDQRVSLRGEVLPGVSYMVQLPYGEMHGLFYGEATSLECLPKVVIKPAYLPPTMELSFIDSTYLFPAVGGPLHGEAVGVSPSQLQAGLFHHLNQGPISILGVGLGKEAAESKTFPDAYHFQSCCYTLAVGSDLSLLPEHLHVYGGFWVHSSLMNSSLDLLEFFADSIQEFPSLAWCPSAFPVLMNFIKPVFKA